MIKHPIPIFICFSTVFIPLSVFYPLFLIPLTLSVSAVLFLFFLNHQKIQETDKLYKRIEEVETKIKNVVIALKMRR